jgi:hypothetical protein
MLPAGTPLLSAASVAASRLIVELDCVQGKGVARLRWTPSAEPGEAQRIGVAALPNAADPRTFRLLGVVPPEASALTWKGVDGQASHTWLVLTKHAAGWAPSARVSFTGPSCAGDDD